MKVLAVLMCIALAACSDSGAGSRKKAAKDAAPAAVPVTIVQAAPREMPVSFEAVARTEGSREVQVRARVAGILEQLYNEGDAVPASAFFFRIERARSRSSCAGARGARAGSRAPRPRAAGSRAPEGAGRAPRHQPEGSRPGGLVAGRPRPRCRSRARVRQAELNLSYTEVNAPIGGITGRALQSVGSLVSPNADSALLTTLTRGDPIWVRFALSERVLAPAQFRGHPRSRSSWPTARRTRSGQAQLRRLHRRRATGTVQMRAELPNQKAVLLPGQYVRVHVQAGTQQAFVVPQTAVAQNETGRFVWLFADGKALQRRCAPATGWQRLGGARRSQDRRPRDRRQPGAPAPASP